MMTTNYSTLCVLQPNWRHGINSAGNTTRANFTTDLNDFTQAQVNVLSLYIQDEIKLTNWLHAVVEADLIVLT